MHGRGQRFLEGVKTVCWRTPLRLAGEADGTWQQWIPGTHGRAKPFRLARSREIGGPSWATMEETGSSAEQLHRTRKAGFDDSFGLGGNVSKLCQGGRLQEAVQIINLIFQQGMQVSTKTYACLLQACIRMEALAAGKQVHAYIIRSGLESNIFLGSTLINMYAKFGNLLDAQQVFDVMPEHDVFSWTAIISAYANQGQGEKAVHLFRQMQKKGVLPDKVVFVIVLKACASMAALEWGKQFHAHAIKSGCELDVVVGSTLINMYVKCGSIKDAHQVFNRMRKRNVVSWTSLVAGYAQQGHGEEALTLFKQMQREGVKPDNVTFVSILKACASLPDLELGKQFHAHIINCGWNLDVSVGNTLVHMYVKCGSIEDARKVFNKMHKKDAVSWNVMILGYAQEGHFEEACMLFEQMQQEGVKPDNFTFVSTLSACASLAFLERGKQVHAQIIKCGFESDVFVGNALVDMYSKCGRIQDARKVFNRIDKRNVVSWNVMIAGYAERWHGEEVLTLFEAMQQEGMKPNRFTFCSILKACANLAALDWGKQVHAHIIKGGLESDAFVGSTLVDMYAKCGRIEDACQAFRKIHERDVVSWNAMMTGYVQQGHAEEALTLFKQMQCEGMKPDNVTFVNILKACASLADLEHGKQVHAHIIESSCELDIFVGNTLVHMYMKCGSIESARQVFNSMSERDAASWNTMIAGYAQQGYSEEALTLFKQMQKVRVKPDNVTFVSILKACASLAALEQGKQVHDYIIKSGFELDVFVGNGLVDMYAKCGVIEDARQVFNGISIRNVVSWTAMITGYAEQGFGVEALTMFEEMQQDGVKPNEVTFLCILSACRHAGLMDEGCHVFDSMSQDHGITPTLEHCACMVDLLGRAGLLGEAHDFINKMPIQPNAVVWMALLGACRSHGNVDLGRFAFECVIKLESNCAGAYVLLSNIYAGAGLWDEVTKMRKEMEDAGVKEPGPWLQLD